MRYSSAAVTGSSGFIGKYLVQALKDNGVSVRECSRSTNSVDVARWEQVEEIPTQDVLFHLAGITNIPKSFENPRSVYLTNSVGTLNMLEWCRLRDIKRMVYVSTFVYGTPEYLPVDEKHPVAPNNPYSQSKVMGEDLCKAYCRDHGLNVAILRLFNIYGPQQRGNFLIPDILDQLSGGEIVLRDPKPKRDFVYIDNVVDALISASTFEMEGCDVFNIGSGRSHSAREIAETIAHIYFKETGKSVSIKYTNDKRRSEIADTVANIEKARNILRWDPGIDIKTGLSKTLRAYLDGY